MSGYWVVAPPGGEIVAVQVTERNLEELEARFKGKLCGVKLPRARQLLKFYNPYSGEEPTARVGDWVVSVGRRVLTMCNDEYLATFPSRAFKPGPLPA